jgi:hypothetical protein
MTDNAGQRVQVRTALGQAGATLSFVPCQQPCVFLSLDQSFSPQFVESVSYLVELTASIRSRNKVQSSWTVRRAKPVEDEHNIRKPTAFVQVLIQALKSPSKALHTHIFPAAFKAVIRTSPFLHTVMIRSLSPSVSNCPDSVHALRSPI